MLSIASPCLNHGSKTVSLYLKSIYACLYDGAKLSDNVNVKVQIKISPNINELSVCNSKGVVIATINCNNYLVRYMIGNTETNKFNENIDSIQIISGSYVSSHKLSLFLNEITKKYRNFQ